MTIPTNERLIVVGVLLGAHGTRGDLRIKSFTESPENIFKYAPFYSESGEKLFEVVSFRIAKNQFIVSPKPIRDREYWEEHKGLKLFVPQTALDQPSEGEFFVEDLVGLSAVSLEGHQIGVVAAVHNFGAGDLLEIKTFDNQMVLVPFSEQDVPELNLEKGCISIARFEDWQANAPSSE